MPVEPKIAGRLTAPKTLSKAAKVVWKNLVGAMPLGVYEKTDAALLAAYCEQVAAHDEAIAKIAELGSMVTGSQGQLVVSPWAKMRNESARLIVTLGAKLGLSPVDRANVNAPTQGVEINPFLH